MYVFLYMYFILYKRMFYLHMLDAPLFVLFESKKKNTAPSWVQEHFYLILGGKVCNYVFSLTQRPAYVFLQESCLIFSFEMSYCLYFFNWTTKATTQCAFETILTHGCCTKTHTHMLCIMQCFPLFEKFKG